MTYKNLDALMNNDFNLELLVDQLKQYDKYDVEQILYAIWGNDYMKKIQKINSKIKDQLLENLKNR